MNRRFTFGNEPDFRSESESMIGEDFDQMRERFNERSRNFRQGNTGFDRWFEQPEDAFPQPRFKIPKEDERSAYVRNIPIFQVEDNENLMRQNKSSIPRPVPPPQPPQSQKSHSPSPPTPSQSSKATARATSSSASDSGIERDNSPRDSTESVASSSASAFGSTFPRSSFTGNREPSVTASAFTSSTPKGTSSSASAFASNASPKSTFLDKDFKKPKESEEKSIPVKVEGSVKAKASSSGSSAIPMGYLPRQRDPKEPIPMGFERPASAPGERPQHSSTPSDSQQQPKATPSSNGTENPSSEKVHRVPIAVRDDLPRSSSAPPKRTEMSPPVPKAKSPMDKINEITAHVQSLGERIDKFKGGEKDHEYKLLDELLTQSMIKLDGVEPDGVAEIRSARRAGIKKVEELTTLLESKGKNKGEKEVSPPAGTTRILISMNPETDKKSSGDVSPSVKKIETEI